MFGFMLVSLARRLKVGRAFCSDLENCWAQTTLTMIEQTLRRLADCAVGQISLTPPRVTTALFERPI